MAKRTKKDLEAEIASLRARVDEQAAVIVRMLQQPPVYIGAPCLRPHADETPYIPYVPMVPVYPQWQPVQGPFGPPYFPGDFTCRASAAAQPMVYDTVYPSAPSGAAGCAPNLGANIQCGVFEYSGLGVGVPVGVGISMFSLTSSAPGSA